MLDPTYLAGCADALEAIMAQLDIDITCDIARRIARGNGSFSDASRWQARKLREARAALSMYQRSVRGTRNIAGREIQRVMEEGCKLALKNDDAIYRAAGLHPPSIASSQALLDVIIAGVQKCNGLMDNLTRTTAIDATHALQSAMDRAYMQVISGAFSPDQAARMVINNLGKKGYSHFKYESGTKTSLEAATRRALLTGLNQTTAELQLARAHDMQTELVEVTAHGGARPEHAQWQGQIYSLDGRSGKYENFYHATEYGTGPGLCGWNCYHSFYPYIEGVSTPSFSKDPAAEAGGKTNDEIYEESQAQRYLERQVRRSRRECAVINAGMEGADSDALYDALRSEFSKAAVLLKKREAALKAFCAQTGRRYDASRVLTFDFGRSTSAKAVWANRKAAQ